MRLYRAQRPSARSRCTAIARLPDFTTYSAGTSYRFALDGGRALTVRVNGDNLTNKRYWATGGTTLYVGAARTVRVSAGIDL